MRHASLMMGAGMMGAGIAMGSVAVALAYAAKRVSAASERATLPAPPYFDTLEPYDGPFEMEPDFASEADTDLDAQWFRMAIVGGDAEPIDADREQDEEWKDPDWPRVSARQELS